MNIEELLSLISAYNSQIDVGDYQYFMNLLENRTIIFNGEVDNELMERVVLPLLDFERDGSKEPVTLYLNTPGGYVGDGLVLCDIIDKYSKPLRIIVLGYAFSMGTIIMCAGGKNPNVKKMCYKFSTALFHPGSLKLDGGASAVKDTVAFNDRMDKRMREYVLSNTLITPEVYDAHEAREWYLSSEELLQYGMVSEIL